MMRHFTESQCFFLSGLSWKYNAVVLRKEKNNVTYKEKLLMLFLIQQKEMKLTFQV